MKKLLFTLVIFLTTIAMHGQTLGELATTAAAVAVNNGKYTTALARIKEAEDFYKNDNIRLPVVLYNKILILDKYYNAGLIRDPEINKLLIDTCKEFLQAYQQTAAEAGHIAEVYAIYIKNEITPGQESKLGSKKKMLVVNADSSSNEENTVEDENNQLSKEVKELKKQLSKLKEGSDQQIGVLRLKADEITVYKKRTVSSAQTIETTAAIDSVQVEIRDGFVRTMRVFTDKGFFSNRSPVTLLRFNQRYNDEIESDLPFSNYLLLGEVLVYHSETGNNFTPDNVNFTLKPGEKESIHILKTTEGLSNYVDYRIYSDFLGLLDEDSNGIVNFEASACIPVMPSNYGSTNIYFFKSLRPNVRYSRFDKKDRAIITESQGNPVIAYRINNKLDLLQKSFVNAGISLDLFTYDPQKSLIALNIPVKISFNLTEVQLDTKENVTSTNYGSGLEVKFSRSNNFGMSIYGYIMEVRHHYTETRLVERINPYTIYNLGSELFFYNRKEKSSAVFLRFNYTSKFTTSHNFFQLQIGYKSSLGI